MAEVVVLMGVPGAGKTTLYRERFAATHVRVEKKTGKDRVPNVAIFTIAKRLEPPTGDEGFDQLFRVRIAKDRSLHVEQMIG